MFPFYKDMGISTQITESIKFWPNDVDVENIIYYKKDQLLKRIENHSLELTNIFHAKQDEYFDIEIRKIHINLYKSGDSYLPIVMKDDSIAEKATKLILEPLNKDRKVKKSFKFHSKQIPHISTIFAVCGIIIL